MLLVYSEAFSDLTHSVEVGYVSWRSDNVTIGKVWWIGLEIYLEFGSARKDKVRAQNYPPDLKICLQI